MNEDIPIRGENTLMLILSKTIYATALLDLALFERYTPTKLDIIFCSRQI